MDGVIHFVRCRFRSRQSIYEFGGRIRAKLQVRVKIKDITVCLALSRFSFLFL